MRSSSAPRSARANARARAPWAWPRPSATSRATIAPHTRGGATVASDRSSRSHCGRDRTSLARRGGAPAARSSTELSFEHDPRSIVSFETGSDQAGPRSCDVRRATRERRRPPPLAQCAREEALTIEDDGGPALARFAGYGRDPLHERASIDPVEVHRALALRPDRHRNNIRARQRSLPWGKSDDDSRWW